MDADLEEFSRKLAALHREGKSITEIRQVFPLPEALIKNYLEQGLKLEGPGDETT
jgi:hypothetical protein